MRLEALLFSLFAAGAPAADGPPHVTAARTAAKISVDGRLDEAAWQQAPAFSAFVESFPNPGAAPDFRTEARLLYDDEFLYIGITCFDPHPEQIVRQLGRRDSAISTADQIEIALDSAADRRTAYGFIVNAAGVQRDQLLFSDVNSTDTWDAVWDAAVKLLPDGWSSELAIPLRALRFSASSDRPWGVLIRRTVPRTHQLFDSTLMPRDANPVSSDGVLVSRFGPLEGITGLQPRRDVELLPYAGARLALRPQFSDPSRPTPRFVDPSLDIGLDFKVALTSELQLTGAVNPDFGQVEADQVILNLSTAEAYFPEKRPFFLQGLDIFQAVGAEYFSPQQMFYSRRIGLNSPILGAVKLTGSARPGLEVGFLDALVMGAGNPSTVPVGYGSPTAQALGPYEAVPDRRWEFRLTEPLHFGPNDALPIAHPVTTNYLAAVARQRFWENSSVGLIFTAATPLEARCAASEFSTHQDFVAAGCSAAGANALGLDWNLRNKSGTWGVLGQLEGSEQVGGDPSGTVLQDGTLLHPGDLGFGGHVRAGKLGGEPFRFDVFYSYQDPKLDLNAAGFQQLSNIQWTDVNLHYVRPNGMGKLRSFGVDYTLNVGWTADGKGIARGFNNYLHSQVQLPNFNVVGVQLGYEAPQFDPREISQAGVPFERLSDGFGALFGNTDPNRRLVFAGDCFVAQEIGKGAEHGQVFWGWDATLLWRPVQALETRIDSNYGHKPAGARWIETVSDNIAVFGWQDPAFLSVTLRQQVVLTPKLTIQVYAQLFSDVVRYGPFYSASLTGRDKLPATALTPYAYQDANPNAHNAALNVNAVLRWEYRLGSTLFLVYTRSQSELVPPSGAPVASSSLPSHLFGGPATDTVLLKWSYWWNA